MPDIIAQVILPLTAAYASVLAMLAAAARRPRVRGAPKPVVGAIAGTFGTLAGGTVLVLGAIGGWCLVADPQAGECFGEAFREVTLLAFGVVWPVLAVLTIVVRWRLRGESFEREGPPVSRGP